MARILIIDDEELLCATLVRIIRSMGHHAAQALTLADGIERASTEPWDAVFLDVHLPDGNGLSALPRIQEGPAAPQVVILTGQGTLDGAELAVRNGAWDYLLKPPSRAQIELPIRRILEFRGQKAHPVVSPPFKRDRILGDSAVLCACLERAAQAAACETDVLITGETGTGKELVAQAIHENSSRSHKPFVVVDCAVLPETLIESILFGHEKGAFTGADRPRDGLIRQAHGGTLFLDEVGELSIANQKKFLRVLQEGRYRPLGAAREIESDFRLISATNRSLDQEVAQGSFRKDLLYRIAALSIEIPPLRERGRDIQNLALEAVKKVCSRRGIPVKGFYPEFLDALMRYAWPGNVRELLAAVEAAVTHAGGETVLHPIHLPVAVRVHLAQASLENRLTPPAPPPSYAGPMPSVTLSLCMEDAEKSYLQNLAVSTQGDIWEMQRISGLSRAQVYRLLKKHEIRLSPASES